MSNWRQNYFKQLSCEGVVNHAGDGNVVVDVKLKGYEGRTVDVIFWAPAPATRGVSFSGSGLPYASPDQAYDRTPNQGATQAANGQFQAKIKQPNAYYVGLGSLYVSPHLHVKVCGDPTQKIYHIPVGQASPFRTLTYPAPPSKSPRTNPMFYCVPEKQVRSQEQILRDSGYQHDQPMPDNFWGLKPPC